MSNLHEQYVANPGPIATFVSTEHFALQSARGVAIAETNGRTGIYLATMSSGLVALAFVGQASKLGTPFFVFGLVLFSTLLFLGVVTFDAVLQASIQDLLLAQRIVRARRFYLDFVPGLEQYIAPPHHADDLTAVSREQGMRNRTWQELVAIPGTVGVINSVVLGVLVGLFVGLAIRSFAIAVPPGVVAFLVGAIAHQHYQRAARRRAIDLASALGRDPGA